MTAYVIEFEVQDPASRSSPRAEATVSRFGHTTVVAPTAHDAVEKFCRSHPDADITEMRRVHA